ncbi:MAG: ABC transporter permease [Clostridia bacterium]|nr:ABC transporter permease [Clostridia bacterium]
MNELKSGVRRLTRVVPMTLLLLAGMVIVFSALVGPAKYLKLSNIMNVISQCSSGVGIVALASFLAICSTGVDLSLGGIVSLAGMVTARILTAETGTLAGLRTSAPGLLLAIAILASLAVGALMGSLNGVILSRTNIPSFIITLGNFKICETLSRVLAGGSTVRISNMPQFEFIGGGSLMSVSQTVQQGARTSTRMIGILPVSALVMVLLYLLFSIIMKRTRFGTYVYAIGGNYEATEMSGVNTTKTRFTVFLLGGVIAAVTGIILTSRLTAASAANGLGLEFDGIAAAVVGGAAMTGGRSTPWRTLIGALIISVLRNGFSMVGMANSLQMIAIGAVLIIVVAVDVAKNRRR